MGVNMNGFNIQLINKVRTYLHHGAGYSLKN